MEFYINSFLRYIITLQNTLHIHVNCLIENRSRKAWQTRLKRMATTAFCSNYITNQRRRNRPLVNKCNINIIFQFDQYNKGIIANWTACLTMIKTVDGHENLSRSRVM